MVKLLVQFEVDDFETWRRDFFEKRAEFRKQEGSRGAALYTQDDKGVTVIFDWDTREKALAYFASAGHRDAEQRSGLRNFRCHVLTSQGTSHA